MRHLALTMTLALTACYATPDDPGDEDDPVQGDIDSDGRWSDAGPPPLPEHIDRPEERSVDGFWWVGLADAKRRVDQLNRRGENPNETVPIGACDPVDNPLHVCECDSTQEAQYGQCHGYTVPVGEWAVYTSDDGRWHLVHFHCGDAFGDEYEQWCSE